MFLFFNLEDAIGNIKKRLNISVKFVFFKNTVSIRVNKNIDILIAKELKSR